MLTCGIPKWVETVGLTTWFVPWVGCSKEVSYFWDSAESLQKGPATSTEPWALWLFVFSNLCYSVVKIYICHSSVGVLEKTIWTQFVQDAGVREGMFCQRQTQAAVREHKISLWGLLSTFLRTWSNVSAFAGSVEAEALFPSSPLAWIALCRNCFNLVSYEGRSQAFLSLLINTSQWKPAESAAGAVPWVLSLSHLLQEPEHTGAVVLLSLRI